MILSSRVHLTLMIIDDNVQTTVLFTLARNQDWSYHYLDIDRKLYNQCDGCAMNNIVRFSVFCCCCCCCFCYLGGVYPNGG